MDHTASAFSFERSIGGSEIHRRDLVNLPLVADQVAAHYEEVADEKSVGVEIDVAPDVLVIGDLAALRRALAQVVEDALENVPRGGRVIIAGETSHGVVTLTISHNGPCRMGEPSAHLWDGLFRDRKTEEPHGLGSEPALVEEIVKAHGGRTQVTSSPAGGSCCTLRLPVRA